jgi:transposase-like protein
MRQKSKSTPASSETLVRNIRRATRKHHAAEEKIRIVLDGLRGEMSIAELCRREGIAESMYYSLVEGVPRGRQAPARRRQGAGRDDR